MSVAFGVDGLYTGVVSFAATGVPRHISLIKKSNKAFKYTINQRLCYIKRLVWFVLWYWQ